MLFGIPSFFKPPKCYSHRITNFLSYKSCLVSVGVNARIGRCERS